MFSLPILKVIVGFVIGSLAPIVKVIISPSLAKVGIELFEVIVTLLSFGP